MSIQQLREEIAARAKEVKTLLNEHPGDKWTADCQAKYDGHMTVIENKKAELKRVQAAMEIFKDENADEQFKVEATKDGKSKQQKRSVELMDKFLRGGPTAMTSQDWAEIRATMSTTTSSQGGYTVQTDIVPMIMDALKEYGGVRSVATVLPTEQGNPMQWPTSDGTSETGELVAENAAASTGDISFGGVALNPYKFSSRSVPVPVELLQDAALDLVPFIIDRLTTRIGRANNTYFTTGTGTAQPRGLVTAAALGVTGASGQTGTVIYNDLVDLLHSVDPAYRRNPKTGFMMHDNSISIIRKIKDSNGRPLFEPDDSGLVDDFAGVILGKPVIVNQDMATMAANAKSILFGDYSKYVIRDVLWSMLHRFEDSAYAANGQVGFLMFTRTGGNFTDVGNSLKYYKNAAS